MQGWLKNKNNQMVLGGVIGGLSLVGLIYYFSRKSSGTNDTPRPRDSPNKSKEEYVKMIRYLKRESYPLLYNTSLMAMNVHVQYRGAIPPEELKKLLITENPQYASFSGQIFKKMLDKFQIDQAEFDSLTAFYEKDPLCESIFADLEAQTNQALEGRIDSNVEVPKFMTQKKTLEVFTKQLYATTLAMVILISKMRKQGYSSNDMMNPSIIAQFEGEMPELAKSEILEREGLGTEDLHPSQVFQAALKKCLSESTYFKDTVRLMQEKHEIMIEKIMRASLEELEAEEKDLREKIENPEAELKNFNTPKPPEPETVKIEKPAEEEKTGERIPDLPVSMTPGEVKPSPKEDEPQVENAYEPAAGETQG